MKEGSLFCFVLFCSIFKNFCTASPNITEPSPCTHPRRELSKDTNFFSDVSEETPRTPSEASQFGGSHNYKTKQSKLPSFIDRYMMG
jgi:hypothetical protein